MYYRSVETLTRSSVLARFGYALSDPVRASILLALCSAPSYPGDLAIRAGVSKQRLSNHLTCLRGCGLVVAVPEGRRVRYELADGRLGDALATLHDVVVVGETACCCSAAQHPGVGDCC